MSDVVMPRMDGITMTGLIRGSGAAFANIPIIGMTALAQKRELQMMIEAGMDHVVTKPFRNSALLRVVEDALQRAANDVKIYRMPTTEMSFDTLPKAE